MTSSWSSMNDSSISSSHHSKHHTNNSLMDDHIDGFVVAPPPLDPMLPSSIVASSGLASLSAMMAMDDVSPSPSPSVSPSSSLSTMNDTRWPQFTWWGTQHQHPYISNQAMNASVSQQLMINPTMNGNASGRAVGGSSDTVDADTTIASSSSASAASASPSVCTKRITPSSSSSSSSSRAGPSSTTGVCAGAGVTVKKGSPPPPPPVASSSSSSRSSPLAPTVVADADGVGQKKSACHVCFHHKVKCDGKRPCQRCLKYNRAEKCIDRQYDMPLVRTRRPRRPKGTTGSPTKAVKVKKEDDTTTATSAKSSPSTTSSITSGTAAMRPRMPSISGDQKDTVASPPRGRTRAKTRAASTKAKKKIELDANDNDHDDDEKSDEKSDKDDDKDDDTITIKTRASKAKKVATKPRKNSSTSNDDNENENDSHHNDDSSPPALTRATSKSSPLPHLSPVKPPAPASSSNTGSREPKVKTEIVSSSPVPPPPVSSPIPIPPPSLVGNGMSHGNVDEALPDDEASSTLIPLSSSIASSLNRKRNRSPAPSLIREDYIAAKTEDEYRFPFASSSSSSSLPSPPSSIASSPSSSAWSMMNTNGANSNDVPDTPDSVPSSASSSSSGPFSSWFRNHNVSWSSTPKPLLTFDETRVVRMALVYLIPWLRDHMDRNYQPTSPGYMWVSKLLNVPIPAIVCPYCVSPSHRCSTCSNVDPPKPPTFGHRFIQSFYSAMWLPKEGNLVVSPALCQLPIAAFYWTTAPPAFPKIPMDVVVAKHHSLVTRLIPSQAITAVQSLTTHGTRHAPDHSSATARTMFPPSSPFGIGLPVMPPSPSSAASIAAMFGGGASSSSSSSPSSFLAAAAASVGGGASSIGSGMSAAAAMGIGRMAAPGSYPTGYGGPPTVSGGGQMPVASLGGLFDRPPSSTPLMSPKPPAGSTPSPIPSPSSGNGTTTTPGPPVFSGVDADKPILAIPALPGKVLSPTDLRPNIVISVNDELTRLLGFSHTELSARVLAKGWRMQLPFVSANEAATMFQHIFLTMVAAQDRFSMIGHIATKYNGVIKCLIWGSAQAIDGYRSSSCYFIPLPGTPSKDPLDPIWNQL